MCTEATQRLAVLATALLKDNDLLVATLGGDFACNGGTRDKRLPDRGCVSTSEKDLVEGNGRVDVSVELIDVDDVPSETLYWRPPA